MSNQQQQQINEELDDNEFYKKHKDIFFKTQNNTYGANKQIIAVDTKNGQNGRFTDHLLHANMYRNHSLNTTVDKERWVNGSKDWMEHLN